MTFESESQVFGSLFLEIDMNISILHSVFDCFLLTCKVMRLFFVIVFFINLLVFFLFLEFIQPCIQTIE